MTIEERIQSPGPKKILALDGGGIRGMITVEILAGVESLLRRELDRGPDFVLADYFDFMAGTSTGAIIAAALSLGWSVDRLRELYRASGTDMFDKARFLRRFRYRYEDFELAERLRQEFGAETTLGSDRIRTLLMLVMRNATTDSPWPITNNPNAEQNRTDRPDCNLPFPLWQLVRASTAAPTYFPPEVIRAGDQELALVDGGLTIHNNPAFQAFLQATVEPYRVRWPAGEDRLLLVSVGTGTSPDANADLQPSEMNLLYNAGSLPAALLFAASKAQDFLCRVFGRCLAGDPVDRDLGDMVGVGGPVDPKLFTYVRYNTELTRQGLDALGLKDVNPRDVQQLDAVEHVDDLQRVGRAAAERKVKREHFAAFL